MKVTCGAPVPLWKGLATLLPVVLPFLPGTIPVGAAAAAADSIYSCTFTPGHWERADWVRLKSPPGEHFGDWVQQDKCIANEVPEKMSESLRQEVLVLLMGPPAKTNQEVLRIGHYAAQSLHNNSACSSTV